MYQDRENILSGAGTGDLELTDIYNAHKGTAYSSPLPEGLLREAVSIKTKQDAETERQRYAPRPRY